MLLASRKFCYQIKQDALDEARRKKEKEDEEAKVQVHQ